MNMISCTVKWRAMRVEFLPNVPQIAWGVISSVSGWEYISTKLLHSNVNNFHFIFHRVGSKVAHIASKIIRMMLFASCHDFWDMGWIAEWHLRVSDLNAHPHYTRHLFTAHCYKELGSFEASLTPTIHYSYFTSVFAIHPRKYKTIAIQFSHFIQMLCFIQKICWLFAQMPTLAQNVKNKAQYAKKVTKIPRYTLFVFHILWTISRNLEETSQHFDEIFRKI